MTQDRQNNDYTPVLVVDLGGTKMTVAVISPDRKVLASHTQPTLAAEGPLPGVERIAAGVRLAIEQAGLSLTEVRSICLAYAGVIDLEHGLITKSPNLPGWDDLPLKRMVEERLNIPAYLINDADAAALGEYHLEAGQGSTTLVLLTVGTGIGGGAVLNGRLYTGTTGSACEFGHILVDSHDGLLCGCGKHGCLETRASGTAMARDARKRIESGERSSLDPANITGETIHAAAREGDPLSLAVIEQAGWYLGTGISTIVNIFNPDTVVLGGSVANMGDLLFEPVKKRVMEQAFELFTRNLKIVPAQYGNNAGIMGAAIYALGQ